MMINNGKLNASIIGLSLFLLISPFSPSFSGSANCVDINTGKEVRIKIEDYTSRGLEVSVGVDTDLSPKLVPLPR